MAEQIDLDAVCKPSQTAIFPFTSRRYRQLADDDIVPPVKRGKIELLKACRDLLLHQQSLIEGRGSASMSDEKKRLTRINADRKQLQLERERGQLIETESAMRLWGAVCSNMRSKLLSIPTKLSPLVFSLGSIPEIKDRLEKAIHEVLNELASPDLEQIAKLAGHRPGIGDVKATSKSAGKRMVRRKKISKPGK